MKARKVNDWSLTAAIGRWLPGLALLAACSAEPVETEKIPEDILSPQKMEVILTDVHLVEGARAGDQLLGDTLELKDYFTKIYVVHGVSKEELTKSLEYYSARPGQLSAILDGVIQRLSRLESEVDNNASFRILDEEEQRSSLKDQPEEGKSEM